MKPVPLLAAAAMTGLVAWAGLTSWRVPRVILEREVGAQILGLSGMRVDTRAVALFTALPWPRLTVDEVSLTDSETGLSLRAAALRGDLRLLPLAGGRLELADLTLQEPTLAVPDAALARGALDPLAKLLAAPAVEMPDLRRLKLAGGRVVAPDESGELHAVLSEVNGAITRGRDDGTLDARLSLRWRGETVELTAEGLRPSGASQSASPIHVSAKSGLGALDLRGRFSGGGGRQIDGVVSLDTDAADRLLAWLGVTPPLPLSGRLSVSGDARLLPGAVSLANARIANAAGRFDGAVTLRDAEGRPELGGTLATERLDLTPALQALAAWRGGDGAWSRELLDPSVLPVGEIDLRLSAATVIAGGASFANAALAVRAHAGRTDIVIGNADMLQGRLKGRLALAPNGPSSIDIKAQATLEAIDPGALLAAMGAARRIAGVAHASVQVETTGESPMALMRGLDGKASVTVKGGELIGVNLPDLLSRFEKQPLSAALVTRGGRTPFDSAVLSGRIAKGVFEVADGTIVSADTRVTLDGRIAIAERLYALTGEAQATQRPAGATAAVVLPFEIGGALESPVVTPDARSLIRRSGAAAPFFEPKRPTPPASAPALAERAPPSP
ncbi:AsmA family protein [Alsobacter sp. SYSU M60028]|uniref:AsmA family protein n=1 Tax=Alsobacter ponti TaxID=2962936 RepID=A0ABT1LAL9_9HYPH|nr:AsmA-like C-terminal region-containing protein [Alsobacter ponti]MCP8938534.1 AsmA family protein [Alsobacter ponti]